MKGAPRAPLAVAVAQIDTTVGDFEGNAARILDFGRRAEAAGATLVLFPELAVCGYPPRDLLERRSFLDESQRTVRRVARASGAATWVFGAALPNPGRSGRRVFNAAVAARRGRIAGVYHKRLLPTYDVFDEGRYFEPGRRPLVLSVGGRRVGVTICEDIWNDKTFWKRPLYAADPVAEIRPLRLDLHVNISASPYTLGKTQLRMRMMSRVARRTGVPLLDCNLVGGNDSLIFDGQSSAFDGRGRLVGRGAAFAEDLWFIELPGGRGPVHPDLPPIAEVHRALVLALKDYACKCGFESAVLGLSGGIDSAVTAALAVEALGPEHVTGVAMPGPYSSPGSVTDAQDLARNLGISCRVIPIGGIFEAYRRTLGGDLGDRSEAAEENIQARIRGAVLMALSNAFGHLVLSTGNKSELAVGYCTLYGDMAGGYALISDIPKMLVYSLAREINRGRAVIPEASLTKPPSAELRPNQKDTDTLPEYAVLDPLIEGLVDLSLPPAGAARRAKTPLSLARDIARRIDRNEYKRRQAAPGPKITARAFGEGRRYPIAQKFRV
ncbi:MAG TPA: NAD+ synthase [Thermoanaerobaculia bacterium]|nr:NAD+ synthase [Thermoanaerobaculia bacterium]